MNNPKRADSFTHGERTQERAKRRKRTSVDDAPPRVPARGLLLFLLAPAAWSAPPIVFLLGLEGLTELASEGLRRKRAFPLPLPPTSGAPAWVAATSVLIIFFTGSLRARNNGHAKRAIAGWIEVFCGVRVRQAKDAWDLFVHAKVCFFLRVGRAGWKRTRGCLWGDRIHRRPCGHSD